MIQVEKKDFNNAFNLFLFTLFCSVLAFGFALSNFTLSVDNEIPILPNFGLDTGRWGQNIIRYHIFNGHLQYFTLLISLIFFSVAAVRLVKLFKFSGYSSYIFCGLFVTFPQLAYELVFLMMADIAGLGILLSVISFELFIKGLNHKSLLKKILSITTGILIVAFTISMYQAFIIVLPTLFIILFFQNTFDPSFQLIKEIKKLSINILFLFISIVVYYISVKIICPPIEDSGYLSSFLSGETNNHFSNIMTIWYENLIGSFFYGEKTFVIAFICSIALTLHFFLTKKLSLIRFFALLLILLSPFIMSFGITNGYHPPRLYVTLNIVFAYLIVFSINYFNVNSHIITKSIVAFVMIVNTFYITKLYITANNIYKHDRRIAEKIDDIIQTKYPEFYTTDKNIYFYGFFPYEYHQKFRLEKSEVFGGSIFNWGNSADNYRLVNYFKDANIADYKMIDTQEKLDLVKDSIANMAVWPNAESIKMINGIVVVKLGTEKGTKLYFEK